MERNPKTLKPYALSHARNRKLRLNDTTVLIFTPREWNNNPLNLFLGLVDDLPCDFLENFICQNFFDKSLHSKRPLMEDIPRSGLTAHTQLLTLVPPLFFPCNILNLGPYPTIKTSLIESRIFHQDACISIKHAHPSCAHLILQMSLTHCLKFEAKCYIKIFYTHSQHLHQWVEPTLKKGMMEKRRKGRDLSFWLLDKLVPKHVILWVPK